LKKRKLWEFATALVILAYSSLRFLRFYLSRKDKTKDKPS